MPAAFSYNKPNKNLAVSITVLPDPEELVLHVISDTEITLDWSDDEDEGEIQVERSLDGITFEVIASVDVGALEYEDTGLTPDTEYFYRVRAFFLPQGYSGYSNTESATTDA